MKRIVLFILTNLAVLALLSVVLSLLEAFFGVRFSAEEFVAELERRGLTVGENFIERVFGDFVIGVGRRSEKGA